MHVLTHNCYDVLVMPMYNKMIEQFSFLILFQFYLESFPLLKLICLKMDTMIGDYSKAYELTIPYRNRLIYIYLNFYKCMPPCVLSDFPFSGLFEVICDIS